MSMNFLQNIRKFFIIKKDKIESRTIDSFGEEWIRYDQKNLSKNELNNIFNDYFDIFPKEILNKESVGFDMGCGSGRWAKLISPKVKTLYCIEPSNAIEVAKENISSNNTIFIRKSVFDNFLPPNSQDFGYSLGVLHHITNTQTALNECVKRLKPGSPFLVYLYYKFDESPKYYYFLWKLSDLVRKVICFLPYKIRSLITEIIALLVYLPLSRFAYLVGLVNKDFAKYIPLYYYSKKSFYTMRTDSRDRFGTPYESRFTKEEIKNMMIISGLVNIKFSNRNPYWHAIGYKAR